MKSKLREVVRDDQDIFDYIGIQPMTPPSGTIFLLKNKYGSNTFIDGKTDGVKNIIVGRKSLFPSGNSFRK